MTIRTATLLLTYPLKVIEGSFNAGCRGSGFRARLSTLKGLILALDPKQKDPDIQKPEAPMSKQLKTLS